MDSLDKLRWWHPSPSDKKLQDLVLELKSEAAALSASLSPGLRAQVRELMRSMNSYYSNLIEGESSNRQAVEAALKGQLDQDPVRRRYQLVAIGHQEVQAQIDRGLAPSPAGSREFVRWAHRELWAKLPRVKGTPEVEHSDGGTFEPGLWRRSSMSVGQHVAPDAGDVPRLMEFWERAYDPANWSLLERVVNAAAAHHRFLWVHPFDDGNGRTARLMSDAIMRESGIDVGVWSPARGLAHTRTQYFANLERANSLVHGFLGRAELGHFCRYFLESCREQVRFAAALLEVNNLAARVEAWARLESAQGRLPALAAPLLGAVVRQGEVSRGDVPSVVDRGHSQASELVSGLLGSSLVVSDTPRGPLRLGQPPAEALQTWFPNLYRERVDLEQGWQARPVQLAVSGKGRG